MCASSSTHGLKTLALENTLPNVQAMYIVPTVEVADEIPNVKVMDQKDFIVEKLQLEEISAEVSALENNYSVYLGCFHAT